MAQTVTAATGIGMTDPQGIEGRIERGIPRIRGLSRYIHREPARFKAILEVP